MDKLQVLGICLEGAGLLITFYGLHSRYKAFAPEGRSELDAAIGAGRRAVRKLTTWAQPRVDRLFRRRRAVVGYAATGQITMSANVRGRVGFGPLPVLRSNKPALAELDRRTRMLIDRISDTSDKVDDEAARLEKEIAAARAVLQEDVSALGDKVRQLAIGDVGLQYGGLAMIAVGLALQGIGAAVGGP